MTDTLLAFIHGYFVLVAFAGIFFLIGHVLLRLANGIFRCEGPYSEVFIKILLGIIMVVFVYSSLITSLKTVSLGYVLVLAFVLYELYLLKRKNLILSIPANAQLSYKSVLPGLFLISLLVYFWFARIILNPNGVFGYSLLDRDKVYYSNIALMMGQTGDENRFGVNNLVLGCGGMQPYHYLDLWLCDIGAVVGSNLHLVSFYLFVYPLLNFLSVVGILALMERFTTITLGKQLVVVALLFSGAFYFNYKSPEFINAVNIGESPMEFYGEKYAAFYPFIILFFLFFSIETAPALAMILFLPVVSVSLLPAVIFGLCIYLFVLLLRKKLVVKELLRLGTYLLILLLFLAWVYSHSAKSNPYLQNSLLYYTDLSAHSFKVFFVELLYRIRQNPFRLAILHLPFLVLLLIMWFKKDNYTKIKEMFWLVFSIVGSSLLLFGVFYKLFDAVQFYTNVLTVLNVFCIYVFIFWCFGPVEINKNLRIGFAAIVLVLLAFKIYTAFRVLDLREQENKIYSEEYLRKIKGIATANEKCMIGTVFGGVREEDKFYSFDKSGVNLFYQPYLKKFYPPIDLNAFEMKDFSTLPEVASIQIRCIESSPLFLYMEDQKQKSKAKNLYEMRMDFIDRNAINYIVVSKFAKVDSLLEKRIETEFKDETSGERFLCLKKIKQ